MQKGLVPARQSPKLTARTQHTQAAKQDAHLIPDRHFGPSLDPSCALLLRLCGSRELRRQY